MGTARGRNWRGVNLREAAAQRVQDALINSLSWVATGDPNADLLQKLREYDPQYIDLLVDDLLWDRIGGTAGAGREQDRRMHVSGSRQAWQTASPIAQWVIWTWTAWGLGDAVEISAEDDRAQETLDEFLEAPRNASLLGAHNMHLLSERVLVDGNVFLVFFVSTVDGTTTVRTVSQDQIEIIANPDDAAVPWFYKRTFTGDMSKELYYPDWALKLASSDDSAITVDAAWEKLQEAGAVPASAVRADLVRNGDDMQLGTPGDTAPGTDVCVLHVAHNRKDFDALWGWPLLTVALPWLRSHKRYMQARLTIALAIAQFARRSRVEGGSRAVDSVIDTINSTLSQSQYYDTNPPAAAGSWHVENQAVSTEELPLRTGASDAKLDNDAFSWIALLAGGLFPSTAGLDTARYATAVQMDKVQSYLFNRYQSFWSAQFQITSTIVLSFAELYGGAAYSSKEVEVSIDAYSLPDFPDMVDSTSTLMAALNKSVATGTAQVETVAGIFAALVLPALQAIGAVKASELASDEAWDVEQPEAPPVLPPAMLPQEEPPEQQEEPEEQTAPTALALVLQNYVAGEIDLDALAENVLAAFAEKEQAIRV